MRHALRRLLDGEIETQAIVETLRQFGDDADHLQIANLVVQRQRIVEPLLRQSASPGNADDERADRRQ